MSVKLSPIETKLVDLLKDGQPHKREELLELIDSQADNNCLYQHVFRVNKKLRKAGHEIVVISRGWGSRYRLIRLLQGQGE